MKSLLTHCLFFLLSANLFSQGQGVGLGAGEMYHNFVQYDYDFSPHKGYPSVFVASGGLTLFRYKEGRNNDENLRFNSLGVTFYSRETDSIHVHGIAIDYGYPDTIYAGIQKTKYTFIGLTHCNYFKAKWNEFTYYILGCHLGAVRNVSDYQINGYTPSTFTLDPSVHGELPKKLTGMYLGLDAGAAYEFNRFFLHFELSYDWAFFFFDYYSLGYRAAANIGINIPIGQTN